MKLIDYSSNRPGPNPITGGSANSSPNFSAVPAPQQVTTSEATSMRVRLGGRRTRNCEK